MITVRNGNYRQMVTAVSEFADELSHYNVGLFYYSGHSLQYQGQNYLIPVNAKIQRPVDIQFEAVNAAQVLADMGSSGDQTNIVILDACRNNPFVTESRSMSRGLAVLRAPAGSMVVYSTAPDQVALDGTGPDSPFTTALLQHIGTPGVEVNQMLTEVRREVVQETHGEQVPWASSSLTSSFYFVRPIPPVTASNTGAQATASPSSQLMMRLQERAYRNKTKALQMQSLSRNLSDAEKASLYKRYSLSSAILFALGNWLLLGTGNWIQGDYLGGLLCSGLIVGGFALIFADGSSNPNSNTFGTMGTIGMGAMLSGITVGFVIPFVFQSHNNRNLRLALGYYQENARTGDAVVSSASSPASSEPSKIYKIGQKGPGGGVVFYDKGSYSNGWRYLEAAPTDQSSHITWGSSRIPVSGTKTAIGTGKANTEAIVSAMGGGTYAASLCADLRLGGYSDWFLPSRDELNVMREEKGVIGGFASDYYWSSSESNSRSVWVLLFGDGTQFHGTYYAHVRAIRAF